ncbi:1-deoxy-D-xylulose-5-phosphate synthase [Peptoanaerobacter stomatis]|uniref:1-deoxy-D-xylulose-5-phosphate synthase n=1 Tax=Peptoanaerobacter stomatis TaxID=796937 RepID=G9XES5_9FIRM|nr:1-deoxy-D-xylulose-5-phosphate synthase [Peptoanaerobacter stomatis]EHL17905.1 1-deoxy-D-xylulose-5-phosphate synthase [Peptoanaerobacter stomatis]
MYKYLDRIKDAQDIKNIREDEMVFLARDIRKFLVNKVSKTGGHLSSNLGVVELTMAIHSVYDTSVDRVIFDVGHQSYVHKILTGRKEKFDTLRQLDGMSGFPKTSESIHDPFNTGHSSTSISAGIGMAMTRDLQNKDYNVISLIGDSSICSGLALEGINFLGHSKLDMLIILNDNEMSIDKSVGGIAKHLSKLRVNEKYRRLSKNVRGTISSLPFIGENAVNVIKNVKDNIKNITVPGALFNEFGINYYGPVDGHNYFEVVNALKEMKKIKGPKILHVITKKGKGYEFAENDPTTYHGVGKFDFTKKIEVSNKETFSDIAGKSLLKIFNKYDDTVAIAAAMIKGTGLDCLEKKFPKRVVDVGMEEENAVTMAAGMAISGIRPYVAIYSTFLQRAYDQILHDVCMQNLPVTFLIDRAGIVGEDGETHNGLYDISYLSSMPNIEIYSPKDAIEMEKMIDALYGKNCPVAIRFPRGIVYNLGFDKNEQDVTAWEQLSYKGDSTILATGKMLNIALQAQELLKKEYNMDIKVINARRIRPVDNEVMDSILDDKYIFTMEDGIKTGGFSAIISDYVAEKTQNPKLKFFSFPDEPIANGNVDKIYEKYGFTSEIISKKIYEIIK